MLAPKVHGASDGFPFGETDMCVGFLSGGGKRACVVSPARHIIMLSTTAIAMSMSADAFAASLSKGATGRRVRLGEILRTSLIFGSVETAAPVLGWTMGLAASAYIAAVDHWVAFGLLSIIGVRMLWDGLNRPEQSPTVRRHSLGMTVLTAVGTSLDAMAVGVTLAVVNADIWLPALSIGLATFIMSGLGMLVGRVVGEALGRAAEVVGGFVLIGVGTSILVKDLQIL
jgi:putative Mn2+ efflux pump MntP